MQISGQQSQVGYEFERVREREVIAMKKADGNASTIAATSTNRQAQISLQTDTFDVSLTPAQEVKRQLIDNLSDDKSYDKRSLKSTGLPTIETFDLSVFLASESNLLLINGEAISDNTSLSVKERLYEYERMAYSTTFQFKEGEDSSTNMRFSLTYEREINIERQLTMTAAEFKDPLILNINNRAELFGSNMTSFDLDGDGKKEDIPTLKKGVWYLAYDKNENGRIDDGTELFGAKTGNGFAELSAFDSNQNGLIEQQDSQFSHLQLWNGHNGYQTLSDGNIKAISLSASNTPFTFTDGEGNPKAQLRQTSVFITENNRLGAIHQIDIAV